MGLTRAFPLFCALLALMSADTASAAGTGFLSCMTGKLKVGLQRFTKDLAKPIQVPPHYRATDRELAAAFSENSQYSSLSQLFSEKTLNRFRQSPEAVSIRDALIKGKAFELRAGRLFAQGVAIRTQNNLRIVIKNIIIKDTNGKFKGFNTEANTLKTGLAKVLTGIYEGTYSIAAQYPELSHLEIVADEILNTKLAQALTHMGFYSKTLGRRLTDEEAKAVAVNKWFMVRNPKDSDVSGNLKNYITLNLNAKITHSSEPSQSVSFQLPDILPIGDPSEAQTRKTLADQGYTKKEIERIFRILSRRLTPEEEAQYQQVAARSVQ